MDSNLKTQSLVWVRGSPLFWAKDDVGSPAWTRFELLWAKQDPDRTRGRA